jgi:glycerol uptake facilitator-like aquaporin
MHLGDLLGYVLAQMAGAIMGAEVARVVLGKGAAQVHWADLHPGAHVTRVEAFWAELTATFLLTSILYALVSHHRLLRLTPALMTPVTGLLVCAAGDISGAGMNPARWFGPACIVSDWTLPGVYVLGPVAGAALAATLRRSGLLQPKIPLTGKRYHDPSYRSVFRNDGVPSRVTMLKSDHSNA